MDIYKIDTSSFQIVTETKQEAFNILLKVTGYDKGSFSQYMGIDSQILEDAPQWAINYLKDIVNAELKHLGYFIKDTKTGGLKYSYDVADELVADLIAKGTISMQPIMIKPTIVTEDAGRVEIRYLINAQDILFKIVADNTPATE